MKTLIEWFGQIMIYAVMNSLSAAGLLAGIKQVVAKPDQSGEDVKLPKKISVAFVFVCAVFFAVYTPAPALQMIVNVVLIGSISIIAYDSVIKCFLQLIPKIFDKFLG